MIFLPFLDTLCLLSFQANLFVPKSNWHRLPVLEVHWLELYGDFLFWFHIRQSNPDCAAAPSTHQSNIAKGFRYKGPGWLLLEWHNPPRDGPLPMVRCPFCFHGVRQTIADSMPNCCEDLAESVCGLGRTNDMQQEALWSDGDLLPYRCKESRLDCFHTTRESNEAPASQLHFFVVHVSDTKNLPYSISSFHTSSSLTVWMIHWRCDQA